MIYLYSLLVFATIVALWVRVSRNLKAQGKGWFMQHWIGGVIGCSVAAFQSMMFSADSIIWNGVALIITVAAIGLVFSPLPKPKTA